MPSSDYVKETFKATTKAEEEEAGRKSEKVKTLKCLMYYNNLCYISLQIVFVKPVKVKLYFTQH